MVKNIKSKISLILVVAMVLPLFSSCSLFGKKAVRTAAADFGEVIKTRVFEDFCTEQELKLWVNNKHDPESKGPILYASFFYPHIHQLPDAYHALLAKRFG